jgi:hypothetical protein
VRAAAATALFLAAFAACSHAPRQRESGSAEPPADSCLDNSAGRAYLKDVWRELQDAWVPPTDPPYDQEVELLIPFDREGNPGEAFVASDTNAALRESVEKAIARAELPETPDELRACLAGHRMSGRFRNTPPSR